MSYRNHYMCSGEATSAYKNKKDLKILCAKWVIMKYVNHAIYPYTLLYNLQEHSKIFKHLSHVTIVTHLLMWHFDIFHKYPPSMVIRYQSVSLFSIANWAEILTKISHSLNKITDPKNFLPESRKKRISTILLL